VVNCTADVRPNQNLDTYRKTQVGLTRELLQAAHIAKANRFMQLSTIEVYGSQPTTPIDEKFTPHPRYAFQQSCLEREQAVIEFCKKTKMEYVIVRPSGTFGKRNSLSEMMVKNHQSGIFQLLGNGRNRFSAIDTRDIGRAFEFLAANPDAANEIFLIKGYDTCMNDIHKTFDQIIGHNSKRRALPTALAYAIAAIMEMTTPRDKIPMLTRFIVHAMTITKLYDDSKIRRLGFVPKYSLVDTVREIFGTTAATDSYASKKAAA
jgi:nucleoside-diphosphate-sugar epimerase